MDLIALRRRLHRVPELELDLPQTRAILLEALEGRDLEIQASETCSSLAVVLRGCRSGATVMLRADMDALPVREHTGLEFAAPGETMHACGHDLHMAGLVGAIHELLARRDQLAGDVLALFQPGEEQGDGARRMIAEGVLELTGSRPIASYAAHVLSYRRSGWFGCRPGTIMAATSDFELRVSGRGGHAARPHAAQDPVTTSALIVQAIQTYVAQNSSAEDPVIVTVGALHAGSTANVIPDRAALSVSIRATTSTRVDLAQNDVQRIGSAIAEAFGLSTTTTRLSRTAPTVNDEAEAALVRETVSDLFGPSSVDALAGPEMLAEDFSCFLEETGGAFILVGAAVGEPASTRSVNHSPEARFDESVIPRVGRLLAELAVRRLATEQVREGYSARPGR